MGIIVEYESVGIVVAGRIRRGKAGGSDDVVVIGVVETLAKHVENHGVFLGQVAFDPYEEWLVLRPRGIGVPCCVVETERIKNRTGVMRHERVLLLGRINDRADPILRNVSAVKKCDRLD